MPKAFRSRKQQDAQTLVFFLICWGTIMLLCGLAIDSGLLYLSKARLARAVDGAVLAAVGNFDRDPSDPATNRDDVAVIMRNFAAANFTDLNSISATASPHGGTASTYTETNGTTGTSYVYQFTDGSGSDAKGPIRYVQVTLNTGSGGAITSATCTARCPVQTYFIGYATYAINGRQNEKIGGYSGPSAFVDMKVSSSAVATRNPRLIMVVIDRSASMLATPGGGASGLPPAVVQFLNFFDTSSDTIGMVSFGTAARLEMPLTTNFLIAGTNNLIDAYDTLTNSAVNGTNEPGVDPESVSGDPSYDPNYATTGVRRLKFGGSTAADDGIRLALEQMMNNSGFTDPDVLKYLVIFTDGKWNTARTMFAAPGYTNEITAPTFTAAQSKTNVYVTNAIANAMTNGQYTGNPNDTNQGPWTVLSSSAGGDNTNLLPVPTLSPMPDVTNAIAINNYADNYGVIALNHTNDTWLSTDGSQWEPLNNPQTGSSTAQVGAPQLVSATTELYSTSAGLGTNYYTHNLDVWLQPGSVAYLYKSGGTTLSNTYVSDYTRPTKHVNIWLNSGDKLDLVVPGYVADGTFYDGLDLNLPDDAFLGLDTLYPRYRADNFSQTYMWTDDKAPSQPTDGPYTTVSLMRDLMFRNYANLLTGFYVSRPDYPLGSGYEPLITEDNPPGAPRARDGLGAYYPGAAFYWPFGGETDANGYVTNSVGLTFDPTYALLNPNSDPDPNDSFGKIGGARHNAWSINMLATNAAPEWAGELFYDSISGAGTNTISGNSTTSASQIMTSSDWKAGAPDWMTPLEVDMADQPTHDTNITPNPSVWIPTTFIGTSEPGFSTTSPSNPSLSQTGGMVSDGQGHYYINSMAWSGRPTHYFDFSQSKWIQVQSNHTTNIQALQLGNWKAWEYAWHARALGVTIYTVGYGSLVTDAQQLYLAQIANATNTSAGGGSNISYNPNQPIGEQFYATNSTQISNDFYSVGQAINAALTQ